MVDDRRFQSNARMLNLELAVHDLRRRFRWALIGYAVLALGVIVSLLVLADQQGSIERGQDRLETEGQVLGLAAGAYCQAGLQPDELENAVIAQLANGEPIKLSKNCRLIVRRIQQAATKED